MIFLSVVFLVSVASCIAALILPDFSDLILLALPCALASLVLLVLRYRNQRPGRRARADAERWIVVDGSNVMHWKDGTARIEPVVEVIRELNARGYSPGVVFDANAGYKLFGRFLGEVAFANLLHLPVDRVHVVPRGTPADPFILRSARGLGVPVVTNDRYRDWADTYAEVHEPGFLVRGKYRDGVLKLAGLPVARREDAMAGDDLPKG